MSRTTRLYWRAASLGALAGIITDTIFALKGY